MRPRIDRARIAITPSGGMGRPVSWMSPLRRGGPSDRGDGHGRARRDPRSGLHRVLAGGARRAEAAGSGSAAAWTIAALARAIGIESNQISSLNRYVNLGVSSSGYTHWRPDWMLKTARVLGFPADSDPEVWDLSPAGGGGGALAPDRSVKLRIALGSDYPDLFEILFEVYARDEEMAPVLRRSRDRLRRATAPPAGGGGASPRLAAVPDFP